MSAGLVSEGLVSAGPGRAGARPAAWRTCLLLLLGVLALGGCGAIFGRTEPPREIAIDLPVARSEAVRRTLAALREQGYAVRETLTSGLEPETEPFRQGDDADAVFRAAISGSGARSRVVLTGTYRTRQLGGLVRGPERPVRRSDDALERQLWARLDNVALMIRRPPAR